MSRLGAAGRGATLLAGILTLIVGFVHVGKYLNFGCVEPAGAASYTCLGPSLRWNTENADSPIEDSNSYWRFVFTFSPDPFMFHWTPVFLGMLTISMHFGGEQPGWIVEAISFSWLRVCLWLIFVAIFGCFGYAGNMGIVVGIFLVLVAVLALVIEVIFRGAASPPTRMGYESSDRLTEFVPSFVGHALGRVVLFGMPLLGLLTVVLGIIVVIDRLPRICADGEGSAAFDCFGPGLIWISEDASVATTYSINSLSGADDWGSFFSLRPSVFFDVWTPLLMGLITIAASLTSDLFDSITFSWSTILLWLLTLGLFANFGYGGNFGVVLGFLSSALAFLAAFVACSDDPPSEKRAGMPSTPLLPCCTCLDSSSGRGTVGSGQQSKA